MVEKINKAPEESKDYLESLKGGAELKKLLEVTKTQKTMLGMDKNPGWCSEEYSIWNDKIILKRELKEENGKIKELKVSINKIIWGANGWRRETKYELTAKVLHDDKFGINNVLFELKTDDWRGQVDKDTISNIEMLDKIIPNFEKRAKEAANYRNDQYNKKKDRMQELAYNDQNEADDMLWNLDQFYNA